MAAIRLCISYAVFFMLVVSTKSNSLPKDSIAYRISKTLDFNKDKFRLYVVGTYMAAHKYFGADFRYLAGDISADDRIFHKKFPSRPLRQLDKDLAAKCGLSLESCIDFVFEKAKTSTTMRRFFTSKNDVATSNDIIPDFAPFRSAYDFFVFRQTAAYYLCSYAVNWMDLDEELVNIQHTGEPGCLEYLVYVNEVPETQRGLILQKKSPDVINDFRSDKHFNRVHNGVMCALLWFCPDPCLGRKTRGNVNGKGKQAYPLDNGNPCRKQKDQTCDWDFKANKNFEDLIRNKINVSCNCEADNKGFKWNNQYSLCIDVDECYEKTVTCPGDKVCRNAPGSYQCTCPRGFTEDSISGQCSVMDVISGKVAGYIGAPPVDTKQESSNGDFVSNMIALVGLSNGQKLSPLYLSNIIVVYNCLFNI